jgi:hypothetical protein
MDRYGNANRTKRGWLESRHHAAEKQKHPNRGNQINDQAFRTLVVFHSRLVSDREGDHYPALVIAETQMRLRLDGEGVLQVGCVAFRAQVIGPARENFRREFFTALLIIQLIDDVLDRHQMAPFAVLTKVAVVIRGLYFNPNHIACFVFCFDYFSTTIASIVNHLGIRFLEIFREYSAATSSFPLFACSRLSVHALVAARVTTIGRLTLSASRHVNLNEDGIANKFRNETKKLFLFIVDDPRS